MLPPAHIRPRAGRWLGLALLLLAVLLLAAPAHALDAFAINPDADRIDVTTLGEPIKKATTHLFAGDVEALRNLRTEPRSDLQ